VPGVSMTEPHQRSSAFGRQGPIITGFLDHPRTGSPPMASSRHSEDAANCNIRSKTSSKAIKCG